jgi:MFS family permease
LSFGFCSGLASVTFITSITDIFQGPKVGNILGFMWMFFALGGGLGPWLGGWLFELSGHYRYAFLTATILCLLACALFWLAAPRKVRLVSGKAKKADPEEKSESKRPFLPD